MKEIKNKNRKNIEEGEPAKNREGGLNKQKEKRRKLVSMFIAFSLVVAVIAGGVIYAMYKHFESKKIRFLPERVAIDGCIIQVFENPQPEQDLCPMEGGRQNMRPVKVYFEAGKWNVECCLVDTNKRE